MAESKCCYISLFLALCLNLTLGTSPSTWSPKTSKKFEEKKSFMIKKEKETFNGIPIQVFECNIHRCQNPHIAMPWYICARKFNQIRKCSKDLQFAAKVFLLNLSANLIYHAQVSSIIFIRPWFNFTNFCFFKEKTFNKFKKPVTCGTVLNKLINTKLFKKRFLYVIST